MISKKPFYAHLKRLATPAALIIAVLLALPAQVSAQFLALDGSAYDIGEPVTLFYTVPDRDDFPKPAIGIFRPEDGAQLHAKSNIDHGSGDISLPAPNRAGRFEARLYHGDQVYAVRPFQTLVPPAPGALGLDWQTVLAGEPVVLSISVPERRFLGSGAHVGHYWPGEPGGSDHAPQLPREILSKSLGDARQTTLTFTAPDQPGTYLFRLFDRYESHDPYLLDEITYAVELPPTPGALSLEKPVYLVGENISLSVDLPEGRYIDDYAHVAMINPQVDETADVAAGGPRQLLSKPIVGARQTTLDFTAPDRPGRYLFRLYDRRESWDPYLLDEITYEVELPPTPGALSLEKPVYLVGENISLAVDLPEGRYIDDYAYVAMINPQIEETVDVAAGGPRQLLSKPIVGERQTTLGFTAPDRPGRYLFRLYDRRESWDPYLLDELAYEVNLPSVPNALTLGEGRCFTIGQAIDVAVELPDGRYIDDYAYVAMINPQIEETADVAAGGPRQLHSRPIVGERQTTLSFTAPDRPGRYLFRLYDRRESWDPYILDEIVFAAVATRLRGSISLQNRRFAFGEAIEVGVSVADGRFLHNTAPVSLVQDGGTVSGGAEVLSSVRQSQALLGNRTATMTFNAPAPAGQYRIELADRNYDWDAFVIDALTITTFDPADPGAQAAITPAPPVPQTEPQAARAAACSRYLEGAGPQNVEIASISIVDPETLDTVDSVRLGEPIRVRLTLAADPGGQVTYIVAIETSGGQSQNIQVSGAEKVILSDPIFVTAAANEDEP